MIETLEQRKLRLKAEINIAENLLLDNFKNVKVSNYMPTGTGFISNLTHNPGIIVSTLVSVGSMFLKQNSKMGKFVNIYRMVAPFFQQNKF